MAQLLVSVGTDGFTNWVRLPDGQKFNLGPIPVTSFVAKLGVDYQQSRLVLDAYLRDGEAMLRVDEGRMWSLLTPRRTRWASNDGPFMASDPRTTRKGTMATIRDDLRALEQHIAALNSAAGKVSAAKMQEGLGILGKLAQKIKSPNQSENATYYNLGAPDVHEVGDAAPKPVTVTASSEPRLTFDVVQANNDTAQQILAKAEQTIEKIDKLAAAGKKFNAAKAKADIHAVTTKVAGILKSTDLTASWVEGDLQKLASRVDQLHGFFAPARV